MENKQCGSLKDLISIFDDNLSASDILSAKVLSKVSSIIVNSRIKLGMTQKEFAQYMNVSQGMVSKWESADYNFSLKTLSEIAAKLNLDLDVHMHKPQTEQNSNLEVLEELLVV